MRNYVVTFSDGSACPFLADDDEEAYARAVERWPAGGWTLQRDAGGELEAVRKRREVVAR